MSYGTKVANTHDIDNTMTATPERMAKNGGVVLAARSITEGGIQTSVGHQARVECVLDALFGPNIGEGILMGSQGTKLDRMAVARSRYEAGMRFRRVFMAAGLQALKAVDLSAAKGVDLDDEEEDHRETNRRRYSRIMGRMGLWGHIAAAACCYDVVPQTAAAQSRLREALDKLCLLEG
jgi:hypothetical protein